MSELELGFVLCWRGAGVRAGVGLHRRYLFRRERVSAPAFAVATFESCDRVENVGVRVTALVPV